MGRDKDGRDKKWANFPFLFSRRSHSQFIHQIPPAQHLSSLQMIDSGSIGERGTESSKLSLPTAARAPGNEKPLARSGLSRGRKRGKESDGTRQWQREWWHMEPQDFLDGSVPFQRGLRLIRRRGHAIIPMPDLQCRAGWLGFDSEGWFHGAGVACLDWMETSDPSFFGPPIPVLVCFWSPLLSFFVVVVSGIKPGREGKGREGREGEVLVSCSGWLVGWLLGPEQKGSLLLFFFSLFFSYYFPPFLFFILSC